MTDNFLPQISFLQEYLEEKEKLDTAEQIVLERIKSGFPIDNCYATLKLLRNLEAHAQPLNWAYWKLVNEWGYTPDRTERDYGEPIIL